MNIQQKNHYQNLTQKHERDSSMYINPWLHGIQRVEQFSKAGQDKIVEMACDIQKRHKGSKFRDIAEHLVFVYRITKEIQ